MAVRVLEFGRTLFARRQRTDGAENSQRSPRRALQADLFDGSGTVPPLAKAGLVADYRAAAPGEKPAERQGRALDQEARQRLLRLQDALRRRSFEPSKLIAHFFCSTFSANRASAGGQAGRHFRATLELLDRLAKRDGSRNAERNLKIGTRATVRALGDR
jgi:hypothetical protein